MSRIYLIDGSAQIHRAFFAIRGLATTRGLPTNAVYGFTTMLRKLLADFQPELVGISFDLPGPTFRHEEFPEYKSHRPKMDETLSVQIPYVRKVCDVFQLPVVECAGYEADDVLATLTRQALDLGHTVTLVSADKDLLQLVDDRVQVLNPGREGSGATLYDAARVEEKMGVPPSRVVDVLALMGDSVDNVPGVPGIGEKGARDLIREFGSVEGVLENAAKVKRPTYREGLLGHREDALLSKRLVTLRTDVPVTLDPDALRRHEPRLDAAYALFTELEFVTLAREYAPEAAPTLTVHETLETGEALLALADRAREKGVVAIVPQVDHSRPGEPRLQSLGFSVAARRSASAEKALLEAAGAPLLHDPKVAKLAVDGKGLEVALADSGLPFSGLAFDALVMAYLINPGKRAYSLEDLAFEFLGERSRPKEIAAPGGEAALLARQAGLDAETLFRLHGPVRERIEAEGLLPIYDTLELPLISVLARMEIAGVRVDTSRLRTMSADMEGQLGTLTAEIKALAGADFNLNSPIQLREILFDKLGLKAGKKTAKTKAASTAEDVLEELGEVHPLPRKILEYRSVQKLKSTYVDALPLLVRGATGRIHATFHQTVAATGRISSSDPNLQNIPIRTAEGRRIREAFVAEPGYELLSADYSQIELRVLAHLSKDEALIETFRKGEDVHDRTSLEVFGPFSPIPKDEQRRRSKMINYALLYGKSAFTLAKDIGISKKEAEEFIDQYFARYPRVRRFLDETLDKARRTGVVRTLLGRLRRLPDLHAKSFPVRMEAERQAINTPIQGSAADLIKKAMVDLDRELRERRLRSRLILQIHDELLLEVPGDEAADAKTLVKDVMEKALPLDVPLVVDARLGANWAEVH
jgi:DNA polymerase-1